MLYKYLFPFLIVAMQNSLLHCASASVHSHNLENTIERDSDGSYRARDSDHFSDSGHNSEFDHEAILGSVREAEEYDKLSPDEAKERLSHLLPKMDLNGDKNIDRTELKQWILNSFVKLSLEEAQERMTEADENRDGKVTWKEYLQDAFGVDTEAELESEDTSDSGMIVREERGMWEAADVNGDGVLDINEYEVFSNPEEHEVMWVHLVNQTLREKDTNRDGFIDFQEFVGERGAQQDKAWLVSERDRFQHDLDLDRDGRLDRLEVQKWVVPDNGEIAEEEVEHLFALADDDHDDLLSFAEILDHHDVFVGSEAADYDALGEHFDDEL